MPGIIVECPQHGFQESLGSSHSGGAHVIVIGGRYSCPVCGRPVPAVDGHYTQDANNMLKAQLWLSPAQADRLRAAVIWARQREKRGDDHEMTARHLEEELVRVVPRAAPILDAFKGQASMALAAWISVLLSLMTFFLTVTADDGLSERDLEQILSETVKTVRSEQSPTVPAAPTQSAPPTQSPEQPPTVTELPTPETR